MLATSGAVLNSAIVFAARRMAWGSTEAFCGFVSAICNARRRDKCR
jgi:hypothetical protein